MMMMMGSGGMGQLQMGQGMPMMNLQQMPMMNPHMPHNMTQTVRGGRNLPPRSFGGFQQ